MSVVESELGAFSGIVGGDRVSGAETIEIRSPYDQRVVAVVARVGPGEVERAISGAVAAFEITRRLPSWRREDVLASVAAGLTERREELARTIALEAGKPIAAARIEVDRAAFTFRVAAEECKRIDGQIVALDWLPGNDGASGHVRRVALGPVAGIAPFNFPLNLVAHKVAPAMAAGNPVLLRPASQTPVSALKLAEVVLDAGWPADALAVLPCSTEVARPLVEDPRIGLLSFTGSPAVGWALKSRAGRKRVTLELGGNAAVIVHQDADLDWAAQRVTWGAFVNAGQSCISVQRVYVHRAVHRAFVDEVVERVGRLRVGDPLDDATDVGPVIDLASADRLDAWLETAVGGGAKVLAGGRRDGTVWEPTALEGLRPEMELVCAEAFGPFVGIEPYDDVDDAISAAAHSDFGLQSGLFTHDIRVIDAAFARIDVGGLVVNDVSTYRIDHMPYGGVKQSGLGREGVRYAIEDMTELKLLVMRGARPT
jgi:glyceraldehyde-3-phosphate dehydrogenase (NADP+)